MAAVTTPATIAALADIRTAIQAPVTAGLRHWAAQPATRVRIAAVRAHAETPRPTLPSQEVTYLVGRLQAVEGYGGRCGPTPYHLLALQHVAVEVGTIIAALLTADALLGPPDDLPGALTARRQLARRPGTITSLVAAGAEVWLDHQADDLAALTHGNHPHAGGCVAELVRTACATGTHRLPTSA